jgi:hypothetical protein
MSFCYGHNLQETFSLTIMKKSTKTFLSILIFILVFFGFYLMLSLAGVMFGATYQESIGSIGWFMVYFCIGIPMSVVITNEFYDEN